MGTSQYFNNGSVSREQFLVEDMVIESIKNHGIDIFYLPRDSRSSIDELFGDDPVKCYSSAYPIEMYLESFSDFGGNQEFFSKFGLEVQKTAKVAVARRTFEQYIPSALRNAPKEGDLIWIPTVQKLMEIKFVESEKNFFQLGKGSYNERNAKFIPYMYELSLENFKYNGELFQTGVIGVDDLQDIFSFGVEYTLEENGLGTFELQEIIYQGSTLQTAIAKGFVSSWDIPSRKIIIRNINGVFEPGVEMRGAASGARWIMSGGNFQENAKDPYDDNMLIQNEANNILDFSETNPFGEP